MHFNCSQQVTGFWHILNYHNELGLKWCFSNNRRMGLKATLQNKQIIKLVNCTPAALILKFQVQKQKQDEDHISLQL